MSVLSSIPYFGESLSLIVATLWTASALFSEVATKRLGASVVNVWRMILSMSMIAVLLFAFTGSPLPPPASTTTWIWLLLSGLVGYVFGDYCLFNAYHLIGSRFAQLFMTISPATAAIAGWISWDNHHHKRHLGHDRHQLGYRPFDSWQIRQGCCRSSEEKTGGTAPSLERSTLRTGSWSGTRTGLGAICQRTSSLRFEFTIPSLCRLNNSTPTKCSCLLQQLSCVA